MGTATRYKAQVARIIGTMSVTQSEPVSNVTSFLAGVYERVILTVQVHGKLAVHRTH